MLLVPLFSYTFFLFVAIPPKPLQLAQGSRRRALQPLAAVPCNGTQHTHQPIGYTEQQLPMWVLLRLLYLRPHNMLQASRERLALFSALSCAILNAEKQPKRPQSRERQGNGLCRGCSGIAAAAAQSRQRNAIAGLCQGQKKQESGPQQDKAAEHQVGLAGKRSRPDGTQSCASAAADEIGREVEQSPNANLVATFHGGSFVHFMDKVGCRHRHSTHIVWHCASPHIMRSSRLFARTSTSHVHMLCPALQPRCTTHTLFSSRSSTARPPFRPLP
jgi:hypothetical protein